MTDSDINKIIEEFKDYHIPNSFFRGGRIRSKIDGHGAYQVFVNLDKQGKIQKIECVYPDGSKSFFGV